MTFGHATESDNHLLDFVQIWDILDSDEKKENRETGFDQIPENRRGKLVCMIAAKIVPNTTFDELYYHTAAGAVVERLALALAAEYQPPRDKEGPS